MLFVCYYIHNIYIYKIWNESLIVLTIYVHTTFITDIPQCGAPSTLAQAITISTWSSFSGRFSLLHLLYQLKVFVIFSGALVIISIYFTNFPFNYISVTLPFGDTEVKLSLCLTDQALRHEDIMGNGCIDPYFCGLGTSWRLVVSFTSLPL
jgi:hypothetical protein